MTNDAPAPPSREDILAELFVSPSDRTPARYEVTRNDLVIAFSWASRELVDRGPAERGGMGHRDRMARRRGVRPVAGSAAAPTSAKANGRGAGS